MNRKNLSLSLIAAIAAIFLAACGSSSKPAPQLMLAMTTPPPTGLEIGLTVPLSAMTTNSARQLPPAAIPSPTLLRQLFPKMTSRSAEWP
jgi:hypothetical protein